MAASNWERRTVRTQKINDKGYMYGETIKSAYCIRKFVRIEDIPKEVELIVKGTKCNKRNTTSSDYLCYALTKGQEKLEKVHKGHAHFPISHLAHDTNGVAGVNILKDEKITGGREKEFKGVGLYHFSWWGLAFNKNETEDYKMHITEAINSKLGENKVDDQRVELLSSHPFSWKVKKRYGPWRFQHRIQRLGRGGQETWPPWHPPGSATGFSVPVDDLLKCYEESLKENYQKRILCTEVYKRQVMHTILVHPKSMEREFKDLGLPTLEDYMEKEPNPVVSRDPDDVNKWIWHPQSTSVRHPYYEFTFSDNLKWKRWDHLTFAFLIPTVPQSRQHPSVSTRTAMLCDGITIPFELLMDKFHLLEVWDNLEYKMMLTTFFNVVWERMSRDKLKAFIVRFWKVIQSNFSASNALIVMKHECINVDHLIRNVMKFEKKYPKELPKYEDELRLTICLIWNIFKTTTTKDQLVAKGKEKGWWMSLEAKEFSIEALVGTVRRVSNIIVETLPLEEILDYDLSYQRFLLRTDNMDDEYRKELTETHVHEKFWCKIEYILSEGNHLCEISNLLSVRKHWDFEGDREEKYKLAYNEILHIMETKQTEQFVAKGGKGNEDLISLQECIDFLKSCLNDGTLLSDRTYNKIKQNVQGRLRLCKPDFYQHFKTVVAKCWGKILENRPDEKLSVAISAQCESIQQLMRRVRNNLEGCFPEELLEQNNYVPVAINKIWVTMETKLTEIKSEVDHSTVTDGISTFQSAVSSVSELVKLMNRRITIPPKELLVYCQNIERYKLAVRDIRANNIIGDDTMAKCKLECDEALCRICDITEPDMIRHLKKQDVLEIWDVVVGNLSEQKDVSVIRTQYRLIKDLIKLIRENFGEIPEREEKLQDVIANIWKVIKTKLTEQKLMAKGLQKVTFNPYSITPTPEDTSDIYALSKEFFSLGCLIEGLSNLTMNTLPTMEFPGYCHSIQQSRQAVKYQETMDQYQLSKQKRKCESEADCETPQKCQHESYGDGRMSEKRQRESSDDDSERQEKRQRLAESSNHGE